MTGIGQRLMTLAAAHTLDRVERTVQPLSRVVEVGPGWGAFARLCQARGYHYTAIDVNVGLLQGLGAVSAAAAFVPPLPLRDTTCDLVVAQHVLEHVPTFVEAQAMLADMRRILRPDGCVAIVSPDLLWVKNYYWDADYSHNFPTSARRLQQLFLDQDLEVVRIEYVYNHLSGWKGHLAGRAARLVPYRLFNAPPTSRFYLDQVYRNRLTFSRSVLIIGRRRAP
ncbi:MAG TPA: class I SAM-dependent methyltransferase [Herpetosiphonaceae bacterium]|nr:class I SAM-dependent methyltransferase [Herpetosiphonaceae bacterium]